MRRIKREIRRVPINNINPSMIITMRIMNIMKMTINKIIIVIIMRDQFMTTIIIVSVSGITEKS